MTTHLCLSVTFLDPRFHGRGDGGEPEWPPSPLRLFQALVAAAAARWHDPQFAAYAAPALAWLEQQSPPEIIAAASASGAPYRLSVPNNAMDLVAKAWSRGNLFGSGDANPATHRAMKTIRPSHLIGSDAVHYVWELPDGFSDEVRGYIEVLSTAARSLVALGWGIDLVAGYGRTMDAVEVGKLVGDRWRPTSDPEAPGLRMPTPGTLADLSRRHEGFLNRLSEGGFNPMGALSAFSTVGYHRATDPGSRPWAAFAILKLDASGFRAFDPARNAATVAGMVRHAVAQAAEAAGWTPDRINTFVHGHTENGTERARGGPDLPRFSYLPLPSLESRKGDGSRRSEHVGSIRRVLVVAPPGAAAEVDWARRVLSGQELIGEDSGEPVGLLSLIPKDDFNLRKYVREATTWSTVTPVVMPGYDDGDGDKAERLLRRAFEQAGLPAELVRTAELVWRRVGFRAGVDLAQRYRLPKNITLPSYHVRVRFASPVRGPLAVGTGRYRGLGVFAAED